MQFNNFGAPSPARKKYKKVTLTAAIAFGVFTLIIGIILGCAFSSGGDIEEAEQQITELEFQLEEEAAKNQKLEETYEEKINSLKKEKAELSEQLGKSENAPVKNNEESSASELNEENESSEGSSSTVFVWILVIVVVACIVFAAYIFLKKNGRGDGDVDDDEYDDDDYDDDYFDDEYDDDEEYEDDEYEDDYDEYEDEDDEE